MTNRTPKIPLIECLTNLAEYNDHYPPTDIYSEGWMLRCVLDAYQRSKTKSPLATPDGGEWFSEGYLASAFAPLTQAKLGQKDDLGESYTHADGVVGHFNFHKGTKARIELLDEASHFCIVEAKMFSPLSKGVSNALYYNQAARNVACIANLFCNPDQIEASKTSDLLSRLDRFLKTEENFGFIVAAPEAALAEHNNFSNYLELENIKDCVKKRVSEYEGREADFHKKKQWLEQWFIPFVERLEEKAAEHKTSFIRAISWENLIKKVEGPEGPLLDFYKKCCAHNEPGFNE